MRFQRIWSRSEGNKGANIERVTPQTRSRARAHTRVAVSPEKADGLFRATPPQARILQNLGLFWFKPPLIIYSA